MHLNEFGAKLMRTPLIVALAGALMTSTFLGAQAGGSKVEAVNRVMAFRMYIQGDSTPFDACSVFLALGRPASLSSVIRAPGIRLLDDDTEGCDDASPRLAEPVPRVVLLDSVRLTQAVGHVYLTVHKGENMYRESYTVGPAPERSVREVRLSGIERIYRVRRPTASPR